MDDREIRKKIKTDIATIKAQLKNVSQLKNNDRLLIKLTKDGDKLIRDMKKILKMKKKPVSLTTFASIDEDLTFQYDGLSRRLHQFDFRAREAIKENGIVQYVPIFPDNILDNKNEEPPHHNSEYYYDEDTVTNDDIANYVRKKRVKLKLNIFMED